MLWPCCAWVVFRLVGANGAQFAGAGGGGTGLFYYAGHGMQIKDRNYLIPVGAAIVREDEVAYNAVDVQVSTGVGKC